MQKIFSTVLLIGLGFTVHAQNTRANVIVIISDDAGYADITPFGHSENRTPNINKLTDEGVKFTSGYVTASVCAPSRAGIMTGRYQQRFGFEHNTSNVFAKGYTKQDMGIAANEHTLGDNFKALGYSTIAIGKWHLGAQPQYNPLQRGFDEFYGFKEGHREYFPFEKTPEDAFALYDNDKIVPENQVTYLSDMFTNRAVHFIEQHTQQPFFMYLAYNAVHTPNQAKKEDEARFNYIQDTLRRTYDAMLYSMDEGIGRVMQCLKNNGLDNNTLVFFINDNGGAVNNGSDNGDLRGMKGSEWEGGIRVGFSMKWPGHIGGGTTFSSPVSSLDIMPTALYAAGAAGIPKNLDGVNLFKFINRKNSTPHKTLYWKRGAVAAIRHKNWKLIRVENDPILLFDIKNDPKEQHNLANAHPYTTKRLMARLRKWERGLAPAKWYSSMGTDNQIKKHRMEVIGRDAERKLP